jgi:molybdenum cofactor biosynthesis protein MoaC
MRIFRFEEIDETLPLLPLAARRALDVAGTKLSLAGWRTLDPSARRAIVVAGGKPAVDVAAVQAAVREVLPPAREPITPADESRLLTPPSNEACKALWRKLDPLERFALAHVAERDDPGRLAAALAEIGRSSPKLTHLDEAGAAKMVDIGEKAITPRRALAGARVRMSATAAALVRDHAGPKGDVLATARLAGIMAAKRTSELIPLCHAIALTKVEVRFSIEEKAVAIEVLAEALDRTGVEMEAMVAASVAALTVYDMLKAIERDITVEEVVLLEKEGGRSGHFRRGGVR